jgi:hypothetical protein
MTRTQSKRKAKRVEPEELCARVLSVQRRYFISRSDQDDKQFIDDEAQLEIEALIESISTRHRKHVGEPLYLSLLSAQRYAPEEKSPTSFFGSVSIRGNDRSALAYLPPQPFWALPDVIRDGSNVMELTFTPMHRGFAHLLSLYVAEKPVEVP